MPKLETHWTEESADDFLFRIAADFVRQIEKAMDGSGVNQASLAKRLGVTEGRVSQVLNNPGNLTLKKIVEYARALGRKVSIVGYDDGDPRNENGPVNAEIFTACWAKAGKPQDFFAMQDASTNAAFMIPVVPGTYYTPIAPSAKAENQTMQPTSSLKWAGTDEISIQQR